MSKKTTRKFRSKKSTDDGTHILEQINQYDGVEDFKQDENEIYNEKDDCEEPIKSWSNHGNQYSDKNKNDNKNRKESKSIVDFDYDKVRNFGARLVADMSIVEHLRYLIVHGVDNSNIALRVGAEKLLKQLSGEQLNRRYSNSRRFNSSGFRKNRNFQRKTNKYNKYTARNDINLLDE